MKFNEDILKHFNLEPEQEKEPVNIMKIGDMLDFMRICAQRISDKSALYLRSVDAEIQLDCIDIVTAKLNDFSQVFKDLVLFVQRKEGFQNRSTSLRYCITSFDTLILEQTDVEKMFLKELLLRNEITHDYFNRELHQQKLISLMINCSTGALDVYQNLYDYCKKYQLLEQYINKI